MMGTPATSFQPHNFQLLSSHTPGCIAQALSSSTPKRDQLASSTRFGLLPCASTNVRNDSYSTSEIRKVERRFRRIGFSNSSGRCGQRRRASVISEAGEQRVTSCDAVPDPIDERLGWAVTGSGQETRDLVSSSELVRLSLSVIPVRLALFCGLHLHSCNFPNAELTAEQSEANRHASRRRSASTSNADHAHLAHWRSA